MSVDVAEWTEACRRAVARQQDLLGRYNTESVSKTVAAAGASGDVTLQIDSDFEQIIVEEIKRLQPALHKKSFQIVTEELGSFTEGEGEEVDWVIIDPVDGSKNAAQGIPQFSLSVAVASGPTMADVWFGYVFDFATNEEFVADNRGHVTINGVPLKRPAASPYRILGCESAEPFLLASGLAALGNNDEQEIRVVGSIAISLCYVAAGRFYGLLTCKECRSVDAAAGQLIARQAGCDVYFNGEAPEKADLKLTSLYRLVAAEGPGIGPRLINAQQAIPLVPR